MIRREVSALARLGPLPSEEDDSESDETFKERTRLLHLIQPPLSDEEAQLLIRSFGVDNCFGLSWTLLHLVESAPSPVVTSPPAPGANQWLGMLWQRYQNSLTNEEA